MKTRTFVVALALTIMVGLIAFVLTGVKKTQESTEGLSAQLSDGFNSIATQVNSGFTAINNQIDSIEKRVSALENAPAATPAPASQVVITTATEAPIVTPTETPVVSQQEALRKTIVVTEKGEYHNVFSTTEGVEILEDLKNDGTDYWFIATNDGRIVGQIVENEMVFETISVDHNKVTSSEVKTSFCKDGLLKSNRLVEGFAVMAKNVSDRVHSELTKFGENVKIGRKTIDGVEFYGLLICGDSHKSGSGSSTEKPTEEPDPTIRPVPTTEPTTEPDPTLRPVPTPEATVQATPNPVLRPVEEPTQQPPQPTHETTVQATPNPVLRGL